MKRAELINKLFCDDSAKQKQKIVEIVAIYLSKIILANKMLAKQTMI